MSEKLQNYPCLKQVIHWKDKTMKEIAWVIGRSKASVWQRLNGHSDFSVGEAKALSKYFEIPVEILFSDDPKDFEKIFKTQITGG